VPEHVLKNRWCDPATFEKGISIMARTKQTFRKAQAQRALKVGTQSHETTLVPATQSAELPAAAAAMPPHAKKAKSRRV